MGWGLVGPGVEEVRGSQGRAAREFLPGGVRTTERTTRCEVRHVLLVLIVMRVRCNGYRVIDPRVNTPRARA